MIVFFMHSILPLILGGLIYYYFRSNRIILNLFLNKMTILKNSHKATLPECLVYNLPDGLWAYSLMSSILLIFDQRLEEKSKYWIIIAFLFPILSEFLQLLKVQQGTFDVIDIIYYLIFSTISFLILKK